MSFLKNCTYIGSLLLLCLCKPKIEKTTPIVLPVEVDIIIAKKQSLSREIEANGSVLATEYVELHPEVSGRLIFLDVPEGDLVQRGTILAKINNADLLAQLSKAKTQLDLAQKQEKRLKQLLEINGVNQSDYDAVVSQVNGFKADVNYSDALIEKTIIRAPFSGIVGLRKVSPGAYVSPTDIITSIQQLNELKIDFTIPENFGPLLTKGKTIEVLIDKTGKRNKAEIVAIEPQVNATTRNISVRAILKDGNANPGSFVKVYINAGTDKNSMLVPSNAIIPEDKYKTMVLVKNGKAKFVKIETGERMAGSVEVTEGIEEGDSVVVTGVLFVKPEAVLRVKSVMKLEDMIR